MKQTIKFFSLSSLFCFWLSGCVQDDAVVESDAPTAPSGSNSPAIVDSFPMKAQLLRTDGTRNTLDVRSAEWVRLEACDDDELLSEDLTVLIEVSGASMLDTMHIPVGTVVNRCNQYPLPSNTHLNPWTVFPLAPPPQTIAGKHQFTLLGRDGNVIDSDSLLIADTLRIDTILYPVIEIGTLDWFSADLAYRATLNSAFSLCPVGFRLPSQEDFAALVSYAGENASYHLQGWQTASFCSSCSGQYVVERGDNGTGFDATETCVDSLCLSGQAARYWMSDTIAGDSLGFVFDVGTASTLRYPKAKRHQVRCVRNL